MTTVAIASNGAVTGTLKKVSSKHYLAIHVEHDEPFTVKLNTTAATEVGDGNYVMEVSATTDVVNIVGTTFSTQLTLTGVTLAS